ncbi:MAG: DNA internalization-related competence protein ComEC/Rec2 [Firmicutes bacterium]|nr:DNA internalization-related competence protein ComEC/Rec2 [Bacillota bacterium]
MIYLALRALIVGIALGLVTGVGVWAFAAAIISIGAWLRFKTKSLLALAWILFGIGLAAQAFIALPRPEPFYGEKLTYQFALNRPVYLHGEQMVWEAEVLLPPELSGAVVTVTDVSELGTYTAEAVLVPPVRYRNPGELWRYRQYMFKRQVGRLTDSEVIFVQPRNPSALETVRGSYRQNLLTYLGDEAGPVALALTTGDRSLLGPDTRSLLNQTGIGHITALSGMHLSVLSALCLLMMRQISKRKFVAEVATGMLIIGFIVFVGPRISLLRAAAMTGFSLVGYISTGRSTSGVQALCWVSFVFLCYNPLWLFESAFLLSFGATLCCLLFGRQVESRLALVPHPFRRVLALSAAIQLGMLPLNLWLFGGVSVWAVLLNTIIVPLLPVLMFFALLCGLGGMTATLASGFALPLIAGLLAIVDGFASLPGWLWVPWPVIAILSGSLATYYLSLRLWPRFRLKLAAGAGILLLVGHFAVQSIPAVWFLDVGQGDAILIRNQRQWYLIDTGDEYAAQWGLIPALRQLGVNKLRAVIISHPHWDHVGGLPVILDEFTVDAIWVNEDFDIEINESTQTLTGSIELAAGIMLHAPGRDLGSLNNNSLLASLDLNQTSVLLTGDIELAGEEFWQESVDNHQILKVPHHGSDTSSSHSFIEAVAPEAAIISCGLNNRYQFPHEHTLQVLASNDIEIWRLDHQGYVRAMLLPGGSYNLKSFGGDVWPKTFSSVVRNILSAAKSGN